MPHISSSLHTRQPYPYKHENPNVVGGVHLWTMEVVDLIFFSVVVNLADRGQIYLIPTTIVTSARVFQNVSFVTNYQLIA